MPHAGGRPRKAIIASGLPAKDFYTVEEVCAATGLHKETVQARLRDGTLKGKKLGGIWKIYSSCLVNDKVEVDLNIEKR